MSAPLILLALAVGAIVGALISIFFFWVLRQKEITDEKTSTELPRGVRQIMTRLDGAVFIVDRSLNVVAATTGAQELSLVGQGRILSPEIIPLAEEALQGKDAQRADFTIARGPLGNASLKVSVHASPFRTKFALVTVIDRGEFQRLDDVRREFVANVSHELKTPIASVSLLAEALQQAANEPETVRNFAERLTTEAQRLGDITQEIIELSKLQAEGALADYTAVNVREMMNAAVERNKVVAQSKNIKLITGGEEDIIVYGDEARLIVALNNLIANAIHYSPENSQVGIGAAVRNSVVEIAVTDKGIGMTKEEVERVFERFYRTDQARSRSTGGSGLGLSIVKHIVANHGGDVRVWSSPGQGSTFTIRIPQALPERSEG